MDLGSNFLLTGLRLNQPANVIRHMSILGNNDVIWCHRLAAFPPRPPLDVEQASQTHKGHLSMLLRSQHQYFNYCYLHKRWHSCEIDYLYYLHLPRSELATAITLRKLTRLQ